MHAEIHFYWSGEIFLNCAFWTKVIYFKSFNNDKWRWYDDAMAYLYFYNVKLCLNRSEEKNEYIGTKLTRCAYIINNNWLTMLKGKYSDENFKIFFSISIFFFQTSSVNTMGRPSFSLLSFSSFRARKKSFSAILVQW